MGGIIKILYVLREEFPTFRPDIKALFGHYLPRHGIMTSVIAKGSYGDATTWSGGNVYLVKQHVASVVGRFTSAVRVLALIARHASAHDAIQVRDQAFIGLVSLIIARASNKSFFYWMSYPYAEDDIDKYHYLKSTHGVLWRCFYLIRGYLQQHLLYNVVIPQSDYVFAQSDNMKEWLLRKLSADEKKIAVMPMGVDTEEVADILGSSKAIVKSCKTLEIGYLGVINRLRMKEFFFDAIGIVLARHPEASIIFVGGGLLEGDSDWLATEMNNRHLAGRFKITEWLSTAEALSRISEVRVAISILPRNSILDMSSPTKVLEYAAIGVPCVATDVPDQKLVLATLENGICVEQDADKIANAIDLLFRDETLCYRLSANGRERVADFRGYHIIARDLAAKYREILG